MDLLTKILWPVMLLMLLCVKKVTYHLLQGCKSIKLNELMLFHMKLIPPCNMDLLTKIFTVCDVVPDGIMQKWLLQYDSIML